MNQPIRLRPEHDDDKRAVFEVVQSAFDDLDTPQLVDLIRERGNARLATVAETADAGIVGHVLASPMTFRPEQDNLLCLGIAPLSVMPAYQGQGIGSLLMRHVISLARDRGVDALFLLGHPGYYPRFGFAPTHIGNEYGATDAFMGLELREGCLLGIEATVCYVPEFAETGV